MVSLLMVVRGVPRGLGLELEGVPSQSWKLHLNSNVLLEGRLKKKMYSWRIDIMSDKWSLGHLD